MKRKQISSRNITYLYVLLGFLLFIPKTNTKRNKNDQLKETNN